MLEMMTKPWEVDLDLSCGVPESYMQLNSSSGAGPGSRLMTTMDEWLPVA